MSDVKIFLGNQSKKSLYAEIESLYVEREAFEDLLNASNQNIV